MLAEGNLSWTLAGNHEIIGPLFGVGPSNPRPSHRYCDLVERQTPQRLGEGALFLHSSRIEELPMALRSSPAQRHRKEFERISKN